MRDTEDESFSELVSRVVDDAKEVARAEVALARTQVTTKLAGYRAAVVLFALAGLLALLGSIGLVVGLILMLAACLGAVWATLIVVGAIFALAGLLGWLGARRWRLG